MPRLLQVGRLAFFLDWSKRKVGLEGPTPFLPYDWFLYLGPLAVCKVTRNQPTRWTRQRRRRALREAGFLTKKQVRRLAKHDPEAYRALVGSMR